jgi:cell division topological specificity factor
METLKDELIDVISRHIDIDPTSVSIEMAQDGRQQRLIADIPLKPSGRRRSRKNV